jgi:predicted aminopeptidase
MAAAASAGVLLLALGAVCLTTGCTTVGYYAQAAGGHIALVQKARPVADWLADPATPPALRERLQLSQRMRDFAVTELHLPDNNSYRRYADLGRNAAVWNVVATPELALTLKTWCFPIMGCVGYRGYFDRAAADSEAVALRSAGWEASVYGVPAYSTLGWTSWLGGDPLLNTFLGWSDAELAQLIFHELAHQVAYASDDTTFNESFAVAVERLGGERWLRLHAAAAARAEHAAREQRRQDFRQLTQRTRERLQAVYTSAQSDDDKRRAKAAVMAQLREEHAALKAGPWAGQDGIRGYDDWIARANNASFGVQSAYDELVPAFLRLFDQEGRDFPRFYAAVRALASLPRDDRRARLGAVTAPAAAASTASTPP